jgi:hypothetical protein
MGTRYRRFTVGLAAAAAATVATVALVGQPIAVGSTATTPTDRRGELVSAEPLRTLSAEQVATELASDDFDPTTVAHGVTTYRLIYHTVDARGSRPPPAACWRCLAATTAGCAQCRLRTAPSCTAGTRPRWQTTCGAVRRH